MSNAFANMKFDVGRSLGAVDEKMISVVESDRTQPTGKYKKTEFDNATVL